MLERFFDETGGMQLVVHSPYGGRINRALGLALRKKFCRTFNFELQAAASDDAIVLSLGPHHSFPLEEVPALPAAARRSRTRCEHAILDSPMFLARWRWNLNRSLLVLRFRGGRAQPAADPAHGVRRPHGRGVPAGGGVPGERHRPDRDPRPRARAPDHQRHAARGARRRRRARRCSSAWSRARSRCTAPTPPSRRCSRTRSSPRGPYAFLDDEELQNRRTNAVHAAARAGGRPRVDRRARPRRPIEQVHGEITPEPDTADDLHDLLCSLVVVPPATRVAGAVRRAGRRGDAAMVLEHRGRRRSGAPPSAATTPRRAFADDEDAVAAACCAATSRSPASPPSPRSPSSTTLTEGRVLAGLAVPRAERLRAAGPLHRDEAVDTEWVSRRLLARMHSYSRRTRRGGVEPATAQDFMRFLLRWQHVAPGTQLTGEAGLLTVVEQLQGFDAAAVAWEPDLLGVADAPLRPRAGSTGSATTARSAWLRLTPPARDDADAPVGGAVEGHADLGGVPRRPAVAARGRARAGTDPGEPIVGRAPPRSSRCCASAARASPPSSARRPTASPKTSSARCGTAWPAAWSCPTGSAPSAPGSRTASATTDVRRFSRLARGAAARRRRGRALVARAATEVDLGARRQRPRRAGRGGRRAAAPPVGCHLPRPRGPRLAPVPVARPAVGAAPARRPRPGARRPLRDRLQRRAVRAARRRSSSSPRPGSSPAPANGSR